MSSDPGHSLGTDDGPFLEGLAQRHAELQRGQDGCDVELYQKASATLRVRARDGDARVEVVRGEEGGTAVRLRGSGGRLGFGAASGLDAEAAGRAAGLARVGMARVEDADGAWASPEVGLRRDEDGPVGLPDVDSARGWLREATERLREPLGAEGWRPEVEDGRVEVAVTVEAWTVGKEIAALRTRARAWAVARLDAEQGAVGRTPLQLAARRWDALPEDGLRQVLEDRWVGRREVHRSAQDVEIPVLLNPETASGLVVALIRAGVRPDPGWGVGWNIVDDPLAEGSLFGSLFDDAGFPTALHSFTHGTDPAPPGPGHYRRPAFRDLPQPQPRNLCVAPREGSLPAMALLATSLVIHPVSVHRWILELGGVVMDAGEPSGTVDQLFLPVFPARLASCSLSGLGPQRTSAPGVTTPALLPEALVARL